MSGDHRQNLRRVVVVGTSGSGKTTLARELSRRLGAPHVELDALHWGADWTETPLPLFRERVAERLSGERWVVDGNYTQKVRDLVWARAETLVWLDYSLPFIMARLIPRTLRRMLTQEELWNGNHERLRELFSRESILLWAIRTHLRRGRRFADFLAEPECGHLTVLRFRSPRETQQWLIEQPLRKEWRTESANG